MNLTDFESESILDSDSRRREEDWKPDPQVEDPLVLGAEAREVGVGVGAGMASGVSKLAITST